MDSLSLAYNRCKLDFISDKPGEITYSLPECFVKLHGVSFDNLEEKHGYYSCLKQHKFMNFEGAEVESTVILPFSSEPRISRKVSLINNILTFITDVFLPSGFTFDEFSIDTLSFTGVFRKIGIISLPEKTNLLTLENVEWFDPICLEQNEKCFNFPLLGVILKTNDRNIKILTGEDLWRWKKYGVSYKIVKKGNSMIFTRIGVNKPEIHGRDAEYPLNIPESRRFRWLVTSNENGDENKYTKGIDENSSQYVRYNEIVRTKLKKPIIVIPITDLTEFPQTAFCSFGNKRTDIPCIKSSFMRHFIQKLCRQISNHPDNKEKIFTLLGLKFGICENASHIKRAKKQILLHWDIPEWINILSKTNARLMAKFNSRISLLPNENSIFPELFS